MKRLLFSLLVICIAINIFPQSFINDYYPKGVLKNKIYRNLKFKQKADLSKFQRLSDGNSLWENIGPEGGSFNFIANDSNKIYVVSGKLFETTDYGKSWEVLSDLSSHFRGYCVYVNSTQGLFVGVNDGIIHSSDGGKTWETWEDSSKQHLISKIIKDSKGDLYALASSWNLGVFKSTDGKNWKLIYEALGANTANSDSIQWLDDLTILPDNTLLLTTDNYGIYRSTDLGSSWQLVFNVPHLRYNKLKYYDGCLYLLTWSGMYTSNDEGIHWSKSSYPDIGVLSICKTQTGRLIVGATYNYTNLGLLYKSDDNGLSWQQIDSTNTNIRFEQFDVVNGNIFTIGYSVGIFQSTDNGDTWNSCNSGLKSVSVRSMCVTNSKIFAGTEDGIFYSTDFGNSWGFNYLQWPIYGLASNSKGDIFAAAWGTIFKSTDNGENWNNLNIYSNNTNIFIDNDDNIFIVGYNTGILRSTNSGNSWTNIKGNIEENSFAFCFVSSKGTYFARTYFDLLYRSTDKGISWMLLSDASANPPNYDGDFDGQLVETKDGTMYLGTAGPKYYGLFKSTDDGLIWESLDYFRSYKIEKIVLNSAEQIFCLSSFNGMYKSLDNGSSWTDISNGLPNDYSWNLFIDKNEYLYVSTYSNGIYRSLNPNVTAVISNFNSLPSSFRLFQNYPNPFNPTTTINYSVPKSSFVTLKVYDILGREIKTLVDDEKPSGNYKVEFNGSNLSSGIYFYRMQAGSFVETKKLILLK